VWFLAQSAGTGIRGSTLSGAKGDVYFLLLLVLSWTLAWAITSLPRGRGAGR